MVVNYKRLLYNDPLSRVTFRQELDARRRLICPASSVYTECLVFGKGGMCLLLLFVESGTGQSVYIAESPIN
jgi:hypothetical protein